MQPGNPPNAPRSHYRNISGFRNIKGKPHFFARVERKSSATVKREAKEDSVINEVYDQTMGQPIIVKNSSRCVIL